MSLRLRFPESRLIMCDRNNDERKVCARPRASWKRLYPLKARFALIIVATCSHFGSVSSTVQSHSANDEQIAIDE